MRSVVTSMAVTVLLMLATAQAIQSGGAPKTPSPYIQLADMPGPRWYMNAHEHGGYIYCFIGLCDASHSCAGRGVWRYDPATDVWDIIDSTGFGGWCAYSCLIGDWVYFAGGEKLAGWLKDSVFRYNVVTLEEDTLANLPEVLGHGYAFDDAGKFHLLGGHNGWSPYWANYVYDPATNSWSTEASLPGGLERYGLAKIDTVVYLLGGRGFGYNPGLDTNMIYNVNTKAFGFRENLPLGVQDAGCAIVDGEIYLFGGRTSNPNFVDTVQIYDPVTDTWRAGPTLPFVWSMISAATVDGVVFLMGGATQEQGPPIATVYKFDQNIGASTIIDPDTMLVRQAYTIDTIWTFIYLGDFTDGHTVNDIDPSSLIINSSITPTSWAILPSHPGFVGEVMKLTLPIRDFILHYGTLWDMTVQTYSVGGYFTSRCDFSIEGEVTMIGHTSGDLDGDGEVTVSDLTWLVAYLFTGGRPPAVMAADVDHDGEVSVADLTALVRLLFG